MGKSLKSINVLFEDGDDGKRREKPTEKGDHHGGSGEGFSQL